MNPSQVQLFNLTQILALVFAIAVPMYWVFVTGKLWPGIVFGYFSFVLWGFAVCFILPGYFAHEFHDKRAFDYFPDGPGAAGMLFMGWVPSLFFSAIALGLRKLWLKMGRGRSNAPTG